VSSEGTKRTATLAIAVGAGALVLVAIVAVMAIAMGAMMDGCHGMNCRGQGAPQTPAVMEGSEVSIRISDFDFSPRDATVDVGATVTWANEDEAPHDATSKDDTWATDVLEDGDSGSVTFDEAGVFEYRCSIHPYMEGKLRVRE
jgi:plastocyanin